MTPPKEKFIEVDDKFNKGLKFTVKCHLWADGQNKTALADDMKSGTITKDEYNAELTKHLAIVEMDLTDVMINDYVRKSLTCSSSPRVSWQNGRRPHYDGSEDILKDAFAINNRFTFPIKDWIDATKAKKTPSEKLETDFAKMTPTEQDEWLQKKIAERKS